MAQEGWNNDGRKRRRVKMGTGRRHGDAEPRGRIRDGPFPQAEPEDGARVSAAAAPPHPGLLLVYGTTDLRTVALDASRDHADLRLC
ncbi:hypothetical protein PR202_gb22256 [Eleusine coracana subsp. coracana]|uniref:Uncharacterized protein n=1 Tax=Eleusine coracana subsp. coracana TaxID=191504 RepID=A0AAV5FFA4_ELECO|nr:hypothetical protein PR202_gb22256 [Eleusine coracana subsp. coracana]